LWLPPQPPGPVPKNAQWLAAVLARAGLKFTITTRENMHGDLQLIVGGKER
jgi:hypothetical protein